MYIGFYVKHPLLMSEINETLNFLETLVKYSNINSNENSTSGAALFHAGRRGVGVVVALGVGWEGRHEETNAFRSLAILRKK